MNKDLMNVHCDLCGVDTEETFLLESRGFDSKEESFRIVRCKRCGLTYLNPRPKEERLSDYYPKDYYAHTAEKSKLVKFKNFTKSFVYKNKVLQGMFSLFIHTIVPRVKPGRLLDIGCGRGDFLKVYKENGWDVYGVEVDEEAASIANKRGLKVFCGKVEDAKLEENSFDVITLFHVLEHLPAPSSALKRVNRLLKKDGILMVGVPNFGCFDRAVFGRWWLHLDFPRHLYHFDATTLSLMLVRAGFKLTLLKGKGAFYNATFLKRIFLNDKDMRVADLLKLIFLLYLKKPVGYLLDREKAKNYCNLITVHAEKI